MYQPRQVVAYGTVSIFLVFIFFYGIADSISPLSPSSRMGKGMLNDNHEFTSPVFPDFSRYDSLHTLTTEEFPLDDPNRRVIIVGDIHGMIKPLRKLLDKLDYLPAKDVLIHVGDIVTKGTHKGSMDILDFMTSNNITGTRGNHDQTVIEWRGWLNWIAEKPGGKLWLENLEKRWENAHVNDESLDVESWLHVQTKSTLNEEKKWLRHVPKGWVLFSDHYKVAKDMTAENFRYLLHLPLRLYVPSAHTFIVHAGLLPSNPAYPMDNTDKQPLARVPSFPNRPAVKHVREIEDVASRNNNTTEDLRFLQEVALLTEIPQNTDPWVVLNMRSVIGDTISKETKVGKPWSKIWKQQMQSCVGYQNSRETEDDNERDDGSVEGDDTSSSKKKDVTKLPCYPSTTIYGHAASRGLDIKRWTIGLDTGCVKRKRLTSFVLGGSANKERLKYHQDNDEDDLPVDSSNNRDGWIPFSDNRKGKIVSVSCK